MGGIVLFLLLQLLKTLEKGYSLFKMLMFRLWNLEWQLRLKLLSRWNVSWRVWDEKYWNVSSESNNRADITLKQSFTYTVHPKDQTRQVNRPRNEQTQWAHTGLQPPPPVCPVLYPLIHRTNFFHMGSETAWMKTFGSYKHHKLKTMTQK